MPICLHLIPSADRRCTGIYRIVKGLVQHAESNGYQISVLFLEDGDLRAAVESMGIACDVMPRSGNKIQRTLRLWQWLRRHPAQIAHLHLAGQAIPILARMAGAVCVIQHLHGPVSEPDLVSVPKIAFSKADAVVASSRAVAMSVHAPNTRVIYAGIDTSTAPPVPSAEGMFRVGVLSRLVPLKRIESVIQATARIAANGIEIQTEICGEGPSEPALRSLANQLKISDRVKFLGWRTDVRTLMAKWHLLAMPSMYEGFPIAALEAMAAGRAVVASRVGGLPELIEDGVSGILIPADDSDALEGAIRELALNRQRLLNLGYEAWKRVNANFSTERMASQTFALYDQLMNGTLTDKN